MKKLKEMRARWLPLVTLAVLALVMPRSASARAGEPIPIQQDRQEDIVLDLESTDLAGMSEEEYLAMLAAQQQTDNSGGELALNYEVIQSTGKFCPGRDSCRQTTRNHRGPQVIKQCSFTLRDKTM